MKKQVRVLGIDDSPFSFRDSTALLVGVVARLPMYIEGIMRTECAVDGNDVNDVVINMIERSRYKEQLKLIMFDGIAAGGFNMIDVDEIYRNCGIPCATITRELPDIESMRNALKKNFTDWKKRMEIIERHPLYKIGTKHKPLYAGVVGMDVDTLEEMVGECTVIGTLPEPLRVAHLISAAMVLGESHGRA